MDSQAVAAQAAAPPITHQPTAPPAPVERLTRAQAEQLAIRHNPNIHVGQLLALAQHQVVREARSAELPALTGSITAEQANDASRIASGQISDSRLFVHAGTGVNFTQLLSDFGHTGNLVASSQLRERAQNQNALATTEDIILATDQTFYSALQAQALLKVAQQTVGTRQTTESQVTQLTRNNLKSTMDLTFADVNLSEGKLLELDAESNVASSMAALNEVLGLGQSVNYDLVDDSAQAPPPPPDAQVLIQLALTQRPDLQALHYDQQAAVKFSHAQRDQKLPTVSALGTVGIAPVRPGRYFISSWDGGIALNVNVPIFNGFLYSAQASEADLRAQAAGEEGRRLHDQIVREVRTAWLEANTAFQRIAVTAALLQQADTSLGLAQTRYKLGLSSIVELSQAQLAQTQAAISNTNAQYQYRLALATLGYQTGAQP